MIWKIPVTWSMCAVIDVEADTLEEAMDIAGDEGSDIPLPSNMESYYVDGSWYLSHDDVEEVRECYNDGKLDMTPDLENSMTINNWNIEELTGYVPRTTFYTDFSIADNYGEAAIKDTYKRSFENWKNNVEYITELVMVLNWKIFEHHGKNESLAALYDELWKEADEWCMDNLKGDDLNYYLRTTD